MYVFQIVDEGLIKRVIARGNLELLKGLIEGEIKKYLDENGFEGTTEDGYAKVVKVDPSGVEEEDHIWSYSFDGEESVSDATERLLPKQTDEGQDEKMVATILIPLRSDTLKENGVKAEDLRIHVYGHDSNDGVVIGRKMVHDIDDQSEFFFEDLGVQVIYTEILK